MILKSFKRPALVLAAGAVAAAGIWLLGQPDLAWLGFALAGVILASPATRPGISTGPASAAPLVADDKDIDLAEVPVGSYEADPARTVVRLTVRKLRWLTVHAVMTPVKGGIEVDDTSGGNRVHGTVPAATFQSGNSRRDLHVIGPDFLDAHHHPHLCFTGVAERSVNGSMTQLRGELVVRGVAVPVTWDVTCLTMSPDRQVLRARAETTVSRSQFGVSRYSWLAGDIVRVSLDLTANRR